MPKTCASLVFTLCLILVWFHHSSLDPQVSFHIVVWLWTLVRLRYKRATLISLQPSCFVTPFCFGLDSSCSAKQVLLTVLTRRDVTHIHIFQFYVAAWYCNCLNSFFFSSIYAPYLVTTKWKQNFRNVCTFIKKKKLKSHLHEHSDPLQQNLKFYSSTSNFSWSFEWSPPMVN